MVKNGIPVLLSIVILRGCTASLQYIDCMLIFVELSLLLQPDLLKNTIKYMRVSGLFNFNLR